MRYSFDRHCVKHINVENNNFRRNLIMRSINRALVVAFTLSVLATTTPANAAERTRDTRLRDRETRVVMVIKRLVKRFFGVTTTGDQMSDPKPAAPPVPGEE